MIDASIGEFSILKQTMLTYKFIYICLIEFRIACD